MTPSKRPVTGGCGTAKRRSRPRLSLRASVDAFCKACLYDPEVDGSWKLQVRACTAKVCPLYPVRPGQRAQR